MTGPALKLTEEQVANPSEAMSLMGYNAQCIFAEKLRSDWRTLRTALDEQVKENERQAEDIAEHERRLGLMLDRATRAEAALAFANEITEEKVKKAKAETIWAIRKWSSSLTPEELAEAIYTSPAFAALLAAQGKQSEAEVEIDSDQPILDSIGRPDPWANMVREQRKAEIENVRMGMAASTPAPQSPDQACGADKRILTAEDHRMLMGALSQDSVELVPVTDRPDTALVRELANQLSTARDRVVAFMLECGYAPETATESVEPADALLTRPDVIAARKGGGE